MKRKMKQFVKISGNRVSTKEIDNLGQELSFGKQIAGGKEAELGKKIILGKGLDFGSEINLRK